MAGTVLGAAVTRHSRTLGLGHYRVWPGLCYGSPLPGLAGHWAWGTTGDGWDCAGVTATGHSRRFGLGALPGMAGIVLGVAATGHSRTLGLGHYRGWLGLS